MAENYTFGINASGNAGVVMDGMKSKAIGLTAELKSLAGAALGVGGLFAGFSFLKSTLTDFNKFEDANVKLASTIKASGGAAGISFDRFKADADELSKKVIFPKSSIIEAESMLAMFSSIRGEMMDRTIPVAADLATKFGLDMPQAAKLLGRSLENLQLGRLQMQLGKMSDAQTQAIERFKEQGKTAQAQAVILDFVRSKVSGLSEAMAKTDSGKLQMAAKSLYDMKIQIGEAVSKFLTGLIPAFNATVQAMRNFKTWITGDSASAVIFRDAVIALTAAFITYNAVTGIAIARTAIMTWYHGLSTAAIILHTLANEGLRMAIIMLNVAIKDNPFTFWITLITAAIIAIMGLWDKCEGFRRVVGGIFSEIAKIVMGVVHVFVNFAKVAGDVFTGHFKEAGIQGKKMIEDFKTDFLQGYSEAWKEGAEKFGKSEFKFSGLLGIGKGEKGSSLVDQILAGNVAGVGGKGETGAATQQAINTSLLGGASGGLGEAKTIKIDFHSPLMQINVPGGNGQDIVNKAPMTMEMLLRVLNNLALSQGSTM